MPRLHPSERLAHLLAACMVLVLPLLPQEGSAQSSGLRFSENPGVDPARGAELRAERGPAVQRVLDFLGDRAPTDTSLTFEIHPSTESKARVTGNERPIHSELATGTVHVVADENAPGDRLGEEARVLVERAMGSPPVPILSDGLAVFFSEAWGGDDFDYWAARLDDAGLIPPMAEMLRPEWSETTSRFIVEPLSGLLVAHLIGRWSRNGFLERYPAWRPDAEEIATLEPGWRAFVDVVAREYGERIRMDRDYARAEAGSLRLPLRGVNFANEGYRRFEGYLSGRSDASLEHLVELGANAVAILPYTFMSQPDEPQRLEIPSRPGSETDTAVIHAVRTAADLGMTVLLKPHIWLRGSWPGEIEMRSETDWDRFFEEYESWLLHYALLAEIHSVPVLSVGVEMSGATLGREVRWLSLVERVRRVYSGALVYAANWGDEFENLEFWGAFDYLGIDAYYPLSDDPNATDLQLREGARTMLDRVERVHRRFDKPVLFTEIGFASTRNAWVRPWEGHLVEETDPNHQLRGYRAVIDAMGGEDWIGGAFWWVWPSDLRRAERDARGYMPAGKPAETVLSEWFRAASPPPADSTR